MYDFLESKLGLLLLDKLLLAVLLLALGFWANRALERFKGQLAFHSEINKQRVAKISLVWEALSEFEQLVSDVRSQGGSILWQEMKKLSVPGLPPEIPREASELTTLVELSKKQPSQFHENVIKRMRQEVNPLTDEANEKASATELVLSASRFWLGKDLYATYAAHYEAVVTMLYWWHRMAEANELHDALVRLEHTRDDVVSVLPRLLK